MKKNIIWLGLCFFITISMVLTGCGKNIPTTTTVFPTTTPKITVPITSSPNTAKPQYGGTISLLLTSDPFFDLIRLGIGKPQLLSHEYIQEGDWSKGPAGGYGTNQISWSETTGTNIPTLNEFLCAENVEWVVDAETQEVVTTIKVRQGIHFALDPNKEASRLVNGREMTADDVLYCLNAWNNNPDSMDYQMFPEDRGVEVVKTNPWELTLTLPFDKFMGTAMRTLGLATIYPPEVYEKYGKAFSNVENDVGTGPYIITDYISGSSATLKQNDNYWKKNPVGPGKGDQLPYIENVKYYILVDQSTQEAALRTAKIDLMEMLTPERSNQILMTEPKLTKTEGGSFCVHPMWLRVDKEPFKDVKVRQALMMATDFNTINDGLYEGLGQIVSWPSYKASGYEDIYLGLDDPNCPDTVKELYNYNPDKAQQLLSEAGYPEGFDIDLTLIEEHADYYSIIKDQWSKVGVNLNLKVIETNTLMSVATSRQYQTIALFYAPTCTWPEQTAYTNPANFSDGAMVDDPYVNEMADRARAQAVTDFNGAMLITKELMKYVLDQAYVIPTPRYPQYTVWWPWLKNYSGETGVGYFSGDDWVKYIWVDQELKESIGH